MRVTNSMLADNVNASLFRQTELMYKTQEKIITGKRINRPSDDPVGMGKSMNYRNTISKLEQYDENIAKGKMHIETMDNVLEMMVGLLEEAQQIAFDDNPDMRANLAGEVAAIREQIIELSNYRLDGDYIFSGHATDTPPFDNTGTYFGDNSDKTIIIGSSTRMDIAADGSDIFQSAADIFTELSDLETDLLAGVTADITSHISTLGSAIDQINSVRAESASGYKRLEATENHYSYFKLNMQELLSQTEDADLAEAIVSFQAQETAYESTLATSSMIMQKSLIDFLR